MGDEAVMMCYNGCPDSALAEAIPGARAVWFPSPGFWQVFSADHKILSGEHGDVEWACREAIRCHG